MGDIYRYTISAAEGIEPTDKQETYVLARWWFGDLA